MRKPRTKIAVNDIEKIKIRIALEELNAAFTYHLDHNEIVPLVELFTENAVYTHGERHSEGRAAIEALFVARDRTGVRTTRHIYSGLILDIRSASAAAGQSVCMAFAADAAPPIANTVPNLVADFIDEYVRDADHKWRIARRDIKRTFFKP